MKFLPNKKEAEKATLEGINSEISAQQEGIKELEQSLTSAQIDLNQLNATYENAQ